LKTSIKFIIATFAVLLIASLALNIYQLHLFSKAELTGDLTYSRPDEEKKDFYATNPSPSSFTRDIDFQRDGYQPQKSIPFWVKSVLANILNLNVSRFDAQIKIFCYQVRGASDNIRNCVDKLQVWSVKKEGAEEAYVAITGTPAETAGTSITDVCKEKPCQSYRLAHLVKKGERTSVVSDTGFIFSERSSKNISISLLKVSQGGISVWALERDLPLNDNFLTKLTLFLSDGRSVRNIASMIIDAEWFDAECLLNADLNPSAGKSCKRQLNGSLRTDFKNSTYWYPSNLVYTNDLNAKGSGVGVNFNIETQSYDVPERAKTEVVELIDQLSFSPTENEEIPVQEEVE
jgi:hypothetical protein